jgi:hypothetical protein
LRVDPDRLGPEVRLLHQFESAPLEVDMSVAMAAAEGSSKEIQSQSECSHL